VATPVVVITGASSGIGEALARRIARDKRHVVLVARRVDRLEALARELATAHGIEATAIPIDLVTPDGPATLTAELERRGLEVDWLVNNAGFGTVGRFDKLPVGRELEEIRLNAEVPVALAGMLLPGMVQRRRGALVNVASVAGFGPMAFNATYGATKAFLIAFSEAIAVELQETGVHVLCVCPGFTRTEFQATAKVDVSTVPGFAWMTAEEVADQTVRAVGQRTVLVNGAINRALTVAMRLAPRSLLAKTTARTNRNTISH
jgi:short-subunit dehydrogenase